LESIVLSEVRQSTKTATQGLLWLLRYSKYRVTYVGSGLRFTVTALGRLIQDRTEELTVAFTQAYAVTLKQYHNFMVKGIFTLAMKACPYRSDFFSRLGDDPVRVNEQFVLWVTALEVLVDRMEKFYEQGDYGRGL
jgi:hypothetical protein